MGEAAHLRAALVSQPEAGQAYLAAYLADSSRDISLLRRALAAQPDLAGAHFALSARHLARGDGEAAALALKRTIVLAPHAAAAHGNLATLAEAQSDFAAAVAPARRAVLIDPAESLFQANLGSFLSKIDRAAASVACYRAAVVLAPSSYKIALDYGITLGEMGLRDQARRQFLRATALDPRAVRPVRLCAELEPVTASSPVWDLLGRLGTVQDRLPVPERSELSFVLAKSLADQGDTARAFAAMRTANALRRSVEPYDEAATLGNLKAIAARFPAPAVRSTAGAISAGTQPVFIIGMPRCGSTLVEQILASHPDVAAAGESKTLPRLMKKFGSTSFAEIGNAYLADMANAYPSARRVTDKMLGNFTRLGFIAAALPGARIIHVTRDPIDCCLSIYSRQFMEGHPYAADLGELGRYYRGYVELMAHWRATLPEGQMIDIVYEQVVDDLPGRTGALLDFLELPWNDRCLNFHQTDRIVRTASQSQVRAPLNREGIGRWHRYIPHIGPLIEALGPLAEQDYKNGA